MCHLLQNLEFIHNIRASRISVPTKPSLGFFAGVYAPTFLSIIGITVFVRLTFIIGVAGIGQTLISKFNICELKYSVLKVVL